MKMMGMMGKTKTTRRAMRFCAREEARQEAAVPAAGVHHCAFQMCPWSAYSSVCCVWEHLRSWERGERRQAVIVWASSQLWRALLHPAQLQTPWQMEKNRAKHGRDLSRFVRLVRLVLLATMTHGRSD